MLWDQVTVVVLEGHFGLGGLVPRVRTESEAVGGRHHATRGLGGGEHTCKRQRTKSSSDVVHWYYLKKTLTFASRLRVYEHLWCTTKSVESRSFVHDLHLCVSDMYFQGQRTWQLFMRKILFDAQGNEWWIWALANEWVTLEETVEKRALGNNYNWGGLKKEGTFWLRPILKGRYQGGI